MFKITQFPIFVKLLKYAIFIRRFLGTWMHDNKTILLHREAGVITWRKCNNSYFFFNTIKYILCTMYAHFGNFSCPNSTKMAKITWPVSMATRFKSHKYDTGFWLFALKDTSCANFIKIGDYRFPPILEILRSLQRSHFKKYVWTLPTRSYTHHANVDLDLWPRTPKSIGFFHSSSTTYNWSFWAATSHLRPPMAFLSHNSSDTQGLAPLMNVSFWGRRDFPISFSGRDM